MSQIWFGSNLEADMFISILLYKWTNITLKTLMVITLSCITFALQNRFWGLSGENGNIITFPERESPTWLNSVLSKL